MYICGLPLVLQCSRLKPVADKKCCRVIRMCFVVFIPRRPSVMHGALSFCLQLSISSLKRPFAWSDHVYMRVSMMWLR